MPLLPVALSIGRQYAKYRKGQLVEGQKFTGAEQAGIDAAKNLGSQVAGRVRKARGQETAPQQQPQVPSAPLTPFSTPHSTPVNPWHQGQTGQQHTPWTQPSSTPLPQQPSDNPFARDRWDR